MRDIKPLYNKHRGQTVYIIGCGPQLAHLSAEQLSRLNSAVTIGTNTTPFFEPLRTSYWCANHPALCFLTRPILQGGATFGVHCEKQRRRHKYDTLFTWLGKIESHKTRRFRARRMLQRGRGIKAYSTVVLEAGQFALFLGAAKIVFIAVQMRTHRHWYHEAGQEAAFEKIKQGVADVVKIRFPDARDEVEEKRNLRHMLSKDAPSAPFRPRMGYEFLGHKMGDFPNAEYIGRNGIHVGVHQDISEEDIEWFVGLIRAIIKRNEGRKRRVG